MTVTIDAPVPVPVFASDHCVIVEELVDVVREDVEVRDIVTVVDAENVADAVSVLPVVAMNVGDDNTVAVAVSVGDVVDSDVGDAVHVREVATVVVNMLEAVNIGESINATPLKRLLVRLSRWHSAWQCRG